MKTILITAALLLVSSVSYADLGEDFQKNCDSVKGSCRVVIAPKKIEAHGYCLGSFMGSLPCMVSFISTPVGAAMNLTCGSDPQNPVLDQDMSADALGFNVATIIENAVGEDTVINDKNEYKLFSSQIVDVRLTNNGTTTTGEVALSMQSGIVRLQNVTCSL